MRVPQVLLFGALADIAGWRRREIGGDTVEAVRAHLSQDPRLAERLTQPGVLTVVNQVMTRENLALGAGDEIAFAPPVSGG